MKTKAFLWIILSVCAVSMLIVACSKEQNSIKQTVKEEQLQSAQDDAEATAVLDEVYNSAEEASGIADALIFGAVKGDYNVNGDCKPIVTVDNQDKTTWPKKITVDFGLGCEGANGHIRAGKFFIVINKRAGEAAQTRTITFEKFTVDSCAIRGTKTITFNGLYKWTISVNCSITKNGLTRTWKSERAREIIEGRATPRFVWDDVYKITGTTTGTNAKGNAYSVIINEPLVVAAACRWIKEGKVTTTVSNGSTISINYSTKADPAISCDKIVTLTINGKDSIISLR